MLKEVGASGQISLGKKFAGQLYDAVFHQDGRVELLPMKVVPAAPQVQENVATYAVKAPGRTPADAASTAENQQWVADHAAEIAQYNAWTSTREPYALRVRRWRQSQTDKPTTTAT
ncbi:hypothetical protein [Polaromonas sp.]|uniref:hypothetical protein n=1 Tax=Polaromonas sp. TaxID=1869339 RepID=UPI002FC8D0B5